jgi:hypothetical protein
MHSGVMRVHAVHARDLRNQNIEPVQGFGFVARARRSRMPRRPRLFVCVAIVMPQIFRVKAQAVVSSRTSVGDGLGTAGSLEGGHMIRCAASRSYAARSHRRRVTHTNMCRHAEWRHVCARRSRAELAQPKH